MGHMASSLMVSTGCMEITRSEMEGPWIGEVIDIDTILVIVLKRNMIVIVIILIREVTRDIFHMILRQQSHLHSIER